MAVPSVHKFPHPLNIIIPSNDREGNAVSLNLALAASDFLFNPYKV